LQENLEEIKNITGESDWDVEVDFEKAIKASPDQLKQIGTTIYDEALTQLVRNLKKTLEKEIVKEAFNEAATQKKIVFKVVDNPKENRYWFIQFENGALVVNYRKNIANMYEIGNFDIPSVLPVPGVLNLVAKLNIQSNQEALQGHLETIKNASGEEYSIDETCYEVIYKVLPNERDKNQMGSTFLNDAMQHLANNLKKSLADDMVKEAFNEIATAHQITFRPLDAKASGYWNISFENGLVVVGFKTNLANLYELGNFNIEKIL